MNFLVMSAMDLSNLVMQMAWVMHVEQNHNTKKMSMTSNNFYHLFQRCPWKMMSKTSEAGIHTYMMKAQTDGCMGLSSNGRVPFFCCLLSTFHKDSSRGITWPFMLFSCIQFLFVCGCRRRMRSQSCWQCLSPFKTCSTIKVARSPKFSPKWKNKKKKNIWWRERYFSFLECSSSMDGLIRGWRSLLWPKTNIVYKLQIIIMHVNKHD